MSVKITFTLNTPPNRYDHVIANIKRIDGLELKEDRDKKGDIVCVSIVPDDNAERTAHLCGAMCNIEGVNSIKIFVNIVPDNIEPITNKWLPFIPMIFSSTVTFFIIYSVLGVLGKDSDPWDVFKLAGIPTIVAFLSQLGYLTQELWLKAIKGIKK